MNKSRVEWDPSWDDDWQNALRSVEEEIEEERPQSPEKALEFYQYGFSAARTEPTREWPDVESELYQDYMTGAPEPGEYEEEEWEEAREWARKGFETSRS